MHPMVFELSVKKKKEEERRIQKSKFSSFLFSACEWGSRTPGAFCFLSASVLAHFAMVSELLS